MAACHGCLKALRGLCLSCLYRLAASEVKNEPYSHEHNYLCLSPQRFETLLACFLYNYVVIVSWAVINSETLMHPGEVKEG